MADQQPFCFVTRLGSYKTIMGTDRNDAQQKGNMDIIIGPVEFCHDGACRVEGGSILDIPNECDQQEDSSSEG